MQLRLFCFDNYLVTDISDKLTIDYLHKKIRIWLIAQINAKNCRVYLTIPYVGKPWGQCIIMQYSIRLICWPKQICHWIAPNGVYRNTGVVVIPMSERNNSCRFIIRSTQVLFALFCQMFVILFLKICT